MSAAQESRVVVKMVRVNDVDVLERVTLAEIAKTVKAAREVGSTRPAGALESWAVDHMVAKAGISTTDPKRVVKKIVLKLKE